ncbi:hypothetical protein KC930_02120 [Candidatus Saccharibacteria bacterium]|nr:hypothetical protein [Candidatus Saccharibacteria bacterium]
MANFILCYARLSALKENIPKNDVSEYYVDEFHDVLEEIMELGSDYCDLEKLKVPHSHVKRLTAAYYPDEDETVYTSEKYVERDILIGKIDAVLNYLRLLAKPADRKRIGFTGE